MGRTTEAVKTTRLSQFLQEVFRADTDLHTLRVAALTLGRLVKAGGPVTAEVVDSEVTLFGNLSLHYASALPRSICIHVRLR